MRKLKIGTRVYCLYKGNSVLEERVGYIGQTGFVIENLQDAKDYGNLEWSYNCYNKSWFTNSEKAKQKLKEIYKNLYGREGKVLDCGTWFTIE